MPGVPFEKGRGAPLGNKNAAKAKRWEDALWKALKQYATDAVKAGEALDKIALKVVDCALAGDKDAWSEIGNRLDGKPHQSLDVSHIEQPLEEIPDGELLSIARRGSNGAAQTSGGEKDSTELH